MNDCFIPEGWESFKLEELCLTIKSGGTPTSTNEKYYSGNIPFVMIEDITRCGKYLKNITKHITNDAISSCNTWLVPSFSLLYTIYATLGKVCINKLPVTTNQAILNLIPNEKIDLIFFYYWLDWYKQFIHKKTSQTTQSNLNAEIVKNFILTIPKSIEEQKKIASILENADNNIDKTQEIINKYEMMKQGLVNDLFNKGMDENGNPHTEFKDSVLGKIPDNWDVKPLKELIEIEHGYAFKGEHFTDDPTDYILLTPGNFHIKGDLYFNNRNTKYYSGDFPFKYILKNGDLLTVMTDLTKEMAILGNTVILESKYNILHNQRIGKIIIKDPKNVFDKYVLTLMNTYYCKDEIQKTATGTTVRHTAPERIYNALVPICGYAEQKRIANLLLSIEKKIYAENKYLNKLQKIKKGLMQDLLTGKVKVKA